MLSTESVEYVIPAKAGCSVTVTCNCRISSFVSHSSEGQAFLISAVSDIKGKKMRCEIGTLIMGPCDANSSLEFSYLTDTRVGCLDSPTPSAA